MQLSLIHTNSLATFSDRTSRLRTSTRHRTESYGKFGLKRRSFPSAQINLGHRAAGDAVDAGAGFLRGGLQPFPLRDHDSQQIPRAQVSRGGDREHPAAAASTSVFSAV